MPCLFHKDKFCHVCGQYIFIQEKKVITALVADTYSHYFGSQIKKQSAWYVPNFICQPCYVNLTQWRVGKRPRMPFKTPMVWNVPKFHPTDCYFCLVQNIPGTTSKTRSRIRYSSSSSSTRPVPYNLNEPGPIPPKFYTQLLSTSSSTGAETDSEPLQDSPDLFADESTAAGLNSPSCSVSQSSQLNQPQPLNQAQLNDLVRDLSLSKAKAELLGSRLQEKRLLLSETMITIFRKRHEQYAKFYIMANKEMLCVCNDIDGLMKELDLKHTPSEWRLFIDASSASLKAVLLNNGNDKPSIPVAHSSTMRETYENMRIILEALQYNKYQWAICGDLKVIGILLGMQGGWPKYQCFLCMWDSRATDKHYKTKCWPKRAWTVGKDNIKQTPLVRPEKIILPPLHIKLGLMKNFVKALDKSGAAFLYLREKFVKLSDAKIKEGVFNGPQIRHVLKDEAFKLTMEEDELAAWLCFESVVKNFLGNHKAENYQEIVQNLVTSFEKLGCRMSLKIHFLDSHLDFFPSNLGHFSEEQGERFHQDLKVMESRYQGRWNPAMFGDYCWFLKQEDFTVKSRKT